MAEIEVTLTGQAGADLWKRACAGAPPIVSYAGAEWLVLEARHEPANQEEAYTFVMVEQVKHIKILGVLLKDGEFTREPAKAGTQ